MKEIPLQEIEQYGIQYRNHLMDNGEKRFRLFAQDGTAYNRTEAGMEGGWQNSHMHQQVIELYVVQEGWILLAQLTEEGELVLQKHVPYEHFVMQPGTGHNIYMAPGAVIHTMKYGGNALEDWVACEELDSKVSQADISAFM